MGNGTRDTSVLNENLDATVLGYLGMVFTLQKLRTTANKYKLSDFDINDRQEKFSKVYNCTEKEIPKSVLKSVYNLNDDFKEDWKDVPRDVFNTKRKYKISNLGRIAIEINGEKIILLQEDIKKGYLKISYKNYKMKKYILPRTLNCSINIYEFVAYAFLNKKPDNKKHIHHIDNNGYDCRPENLILLEAEQHSYVHGFSCEYYKD